MQILSKDIPQANVLDEAIRAVIAVSNGARTDEEIGTSIDKGDRNGRYYRLAGEILGFLHNERGQNEATLTAKGQEFTGSPEERERLLAGAVLNARLFQRVVPFLEAAGPNGITRPQLDAFIREVTEPAKGETTAHRRSSTIVHWLKRISMLREGNGQLILSGTLPDGVEVMHYDAPDEPLSPTQYTLTDYNNIAEKARSAEGYLASQIDAAALERAGLAHQMLTNCVANKIRLAGAIPKQNRYIDLSATINNNHYLFEMKSTTSANAHGQVRKAISQLYEYRYIQQAPDAKLVVVIENPMPEDKRWLIDYVVNDRQLLIAWDGDRTNLYCPDQLRGELGFLVQP
jgi:hypothetical protein